MDLSLVLPSEVLWNIFQRLSPVDLRALGAANHTFHALVHDDDSLWRSVYAHRWPGSRPHLPAEGSPPDVTGPWRTAVERRERALRWAALLATEGQEEPSSLIANPRRRFDYLAELVGLLAERRSEEAGQIRRLGEKLARGLAESTISSVLESRHPASVVRLACVALADLAFEEAALGVVLQAQLATYTGGGFQDQCFSSSLTRNLAAAYLHATMGLSLMDVTGTDLKVPAALLPTETFEDFNDVACANLISPQEASTTDTTSMASRAVAPTADSVRQLCQVLTGSWRGYYFYPRADTYDEEMRLTLAFTQGAALGSLPLRVLIF